MKPIITSIPTVPRRGNENWTPIEVIDQSGVLHTTGVYDSYYGEQVFWPHEGGGWWTGNLEGFLVRPHGSTILHEYVDYSRDPNRIAPTTCRHCPTKDGNHARKSRRRK